jgi:ATP-dependent RNA helicase DDX49/DBP8
VPIRALPFCEYRFRTVDTLRQEYVFVPAKVKEVFLHHILDTILDGGQAIVFCSTQWMTQLVADMLIKLDISATPLHALLSQGRRLASLGKFRARKVDVLVATDVASRGLDIPTVELVVNFDIPRFVADYVHRVGRTARAGRGGRAISIISQYDVELVKAIEAEVGRELVDAEIDEDTVLKNLSRCCAASLISRRCTPCLEHWLSIALSLGPIFM